MDKVTQNPTEYTIINLVSVVEANAYKAGAKACLDMIHCLFMENDSTGKE